MDRDLTVAFQAALGARGLKAVIFAQMEFTSGNIYVWSGVGAKSWNGQTWSGLGYFWSISTITETKEVQANGLVLTLSGIPTTLLGYALTECRQGNDVKLWIGALDDAGDVIADPYQAFGGLMDVPKINEDGDKATIEITVESRIYALGRAKSRRWTDADQKLRSATDKGFEYVMDLGNGYVGWWGRKTDTPNTTSTTPTVPTNPGGTYNPWTNPYGVPANMPGLE